MDTDSDACNVIFPMATMLQSLLYFDIIDNDHA